MARPVPYIWGGSVCLSIGGWSERVRRGSGLLPFRFWLPRVLLSLRLSRSLLLSQFERVRDREILRGEGPKLKTGTEKATTRYHVQPARSTHTHMAVERATRARGGGPAGPVGEGGLVGRARVGATSGDCGACGNPAPGPAHRDLSGMFPTSRNGPLSEAASLGSGGEGYRSAASGADSPPWALAAARRAVCASRRISS